MKILNIILIIVAILLIIAGGALFAAGFLGVDWDAKAIPTVKEVDEDFENIQIDVTTTDVFFEMSSDGKASVVSECPEGVEFSVKVENGDRKSVV